MARYEKKAKVLNAALAIFFLNIVNCSSVYPQNDSEPLYSEARVEMQASVGSASDETNPVAPSRESAKWVSPVEVKEITSKELSDHKPYDKVKLVLNGESVEPIGPVLAAVDGKVWLPLAVIAKRLNIVLLDLKKGKFNYIRLDGTPLELEAGSKSALVNGQLFLTMDEPILQYKGTYMIKSSTLDLMSQTETAWSSEPPSIAITTFYSKNTFTVFEKPKPPEEKNAEEMPPIVVIPPRMGRLLPTPPDVMPDIKINATNNMIYEYDNLNHKRFRTDEMSLSGDIYKYKVNSYLKWEDKVSGALTNTSKFAGIYGNDVWIRTMDLYENLTPLRSQYESYEGVEVRTFHAPFTSSVFGGRKDLTVAGPAAIGPIKYFGKIGGISESYKSNILDLKGEVIGIQNDAEMQGGVAQTSLPRRNLVYFTDGTFHLPYKVDLSGQYAFCNYNPDNLKSELIQDNDIRLMAKLDREMFSTSYRYEFIGSSYASLGNPDNYQGYKDWVATVGYKPAPFLRLSGNYTDSRNNVDELITQSTTRSRTLTTALALDLPSTSNLTLSWYGSDSITDAPGFEDSGTISTDYRADFFKNWEDKMLQLSYDKYITNAIDSDNDMDSKTYSVSFYKFIRPLRGSYVRVREDYVRTKSRTFGSATTQEYTTALGARYYVTKDLYIYGDWLVKITTRERFSDTAPMSFKAGAQWTFGKNLILGVDYVFNPFDLYHANLQNTRDWNIVFRVVPQIEITSPMKWARIEGYVFNDVNENGIFDPGEPGVPNIIIEVPTENIVKTDKNGHYIIKDVTAGSKIVKLDTKDIPIELAPIKSTSMVVEAESLKTTRLDFALVEYGSINGMVYVDSNGNGTHDLGEEGVEGVKVILASTAQWRECDENGIFAFDYVMPGEYEIQADGKTLPKEYVWKTKLPIKMVIKKGERVSNMEIAVINKPLEVKIFKPGNSK